MFFSYPQYKDSGLAWLGQVPQEWDLLRLGTCFWQRREKVNDREHQPLSVTKSGVVPRLESAAKSDDGENRKRVRVGDFVINGRSDRRGSAGCSAYHGSVSIVNLVLEPRALKPCFVHYLLRSHTFQEEFYRHGKGLVADLWSTSYAAMKNIVLPVPSPREQQQIAWVLDQQIAKIDALIQKQQGLIALLQEQSQARIDQAATRGLRTRAPLVDSGPTWMGPVPAHWTLAQLRHVVDPQSSISYGIVQPGPPLETGVPFVQSSNLSRAAFTRGSLQNTSPSIAAAHPRSRLNGGEVILGIRASIGAAFVVPQHLAGSNLSRGVARIVPGPALHPEFLVWYLRSATAQRYWQRSCQGSIFNEVSLETVRRLWLPLPPLAEQVQISEHLREQEEKRLTLIDTTNRAIALLQERKTSLICAAVTGKIDLRQDPTKREQAEP